METTTDFDAIPEAAGLSREMGDRLVSYLRPLLVSLDRWLDARLVRTFAATVLNILRHRDRALSLLLTELGELLTDGAHAPAGVKRLWRLLRSAKWEAGLLEEWLLSEADQAVSRAQARDGVAFAVLDGSGIEKPMAKQMEGLTKIRSATAARLQRACRGPRKEPVIVPGFGWVAVIVTGLTGSLTLGRLHWYSPTAPAEAGQQQRQAEWAVLGPLLARWEQRVIWLLDRGYGVHSFLGELVCRGVRFIARWRRDYHLVDAASGQLQTARQLTQRIRSRWQATLLDPHTHSPRRVGLASLPVHLSGSMLPLWLVVIRPQGKKSSIWLVTTEDASGEAATLRIACAYLRRWQVEWAFRYGKADLGLASIRVQGWKEREKLWRLAELAHAFLLSLLVLREDSLLSRVLRWCHRTGRKYREVIAPLYRLRHGLANLWNQHLPILVWSP